jgi:hypothetical protein
LSTTYAGSESAHALALLTPLGSDRDERARRKSDAKYGRQVASIDGNLRAAAERNAKTAVDRYVDGDFAMFAIAAGLAVELAVKFRLAQESPLYLADGSSKTWFRHAHALWIARNDIELLPAEVRTITAQEAFDRAVELDPIYGRIRSAFVDVMSARNSQAHMGVSGSRDVREAFAQFVRATEVLLTVSAAFWAPHEELVRTLLDNFAAAVAKRVQEKLAAARAVFERRFGGLPARLREAAIELATTTNTVPLRDDAVSATCPACSSSALLGGTNRVESIDSHSDYPSYAVFLEADWLRCAACELRLEGAEELEEAGVEPVVENNEVDVAELFADYEPDEDYFRDR